jgi:hypothetical protein
MFHLHDRLPDQQRILDDEHIDELHRPVIPVRADRSYGTGWMIGRAFDGTTVVYHTGNQAGVVNVMMLLPSRDIACVVLTNHDVDYDLMERTRDAALRTLVPGWTWQSLPAPAAQPLPQNYRGTWRGHVHDGAGEIPVVLSIADQASSLQVGSQAPEPIMQLGLIEGVLTGKTRGKLEFPAAKAAQAEGISLRLQLRGPQLAGEIGTESRSLAPSCPATFRSGPSLLACNTESARRSQVASFCSFPPGADSISFTNSSVIFGSNPSVCPLSSRSTSATTRPSLQFANVEISALPGAGSNPQPGRSWLSRLLS